MDVISYARGKKYTDEKIAEQMLKIAKVEKDLNDYQKVMSNININQEPTQKVSGYGIIGLPKNTANGQVGVSVKGNTYTQILEIDKRDWRNSFTAYGDSEITQNSAIIRGAFSHRIELNNPIEYREGKKYGMLIRAYPDDITIWYRGTNKGYKVEDGYIKTVFNYDELDTSHTERRRFWKSSGTEDITITKLIIIELDTQSEWDFNNLSPEELDKKYTYIDGTKSTIGALRIRSVSEDESEVSTAYVTAKDEEGKIVELRSLPNGTKDEIDVTRGKLIKRVSDEIALSNLTWLNSSAGETTNYWSVVSNSFLPTGDSHTANSIRLKNYSETAIVSSLTIYNETDGRIVRRAPNVDNIYIKIPKSEINGTIDNAKAKAWFEQNQITLTYQLATPLEIPIQVSGTLVSYPSGTVYVEPFVADAGLYNNGITVLYQDLPIKSIEKISKIDYETGIEYELNKSKVVINTDKLSLTHPDLQNGDIVFFIYEYDKESTIPEIEVEFYDSRYVVKDSATGKFYKWSITVTNGTPSIQLTEV